MDEASKPTISTSGKPVSAPPTPPKSATSSHLPDETMALVPATAAQASDLSGDGLLATLPRITFGGNNVPAVGGIALLNKLGQGGMGAVYFGIHPRLKSEVAVKILPFQMASQQPQLIQRFYREAQIAAKVKSPHLVSVMDVNEEHGLFYQVMEFVQGTSAGARMRTLTAAGSVMDEATALVICIAATEGLAAAHDAGIIHRDIKPDNILIPKGKGDELNFAAAKLADLGLARLDNSDSSLTTSQSTMGTPGYMAPEQANDARTAGKPSDVFSMGATLYAMACGEPPFQESTPLSTILASIQKPHRPITNFRNDLSAGTIEVIERCLAKSPEARYADANALLDALRNCYSAIAPIGIPSGTTSRLATGTTRTILAPQRTPSSVVAQPIQTLQQPSSVAAAQPPSKLRTPLIAAVAVLFVAVLGLAAWQLLGSSKNDTVAEKKSETKDKKADESKSPDPVNSTGTSSGTAVSTPPINPQDTDKQIQQAREAGARDATLKALQSSVKDATDAVAAAERNLADVTRKQQAAREAETTASTNLNRQKDAVDEAYKTEQVSGKLLAMAASKFQAEEAKLKEDEKLHGAHPLLERKALMPFKLEMEAAAKNHEAALSDLNKAKEDAQVAMKAHRTAKTAADTAKGAVEAAQKEVDDAQNNLNKKNKELQDFQASIIPPNTIQGAYKLYDGPWKVEVSDKAALKDSTHTKQIALRIYYPQMAQPKKCPVIIFSQGWPASSEDYPILSRFWASHGYVCIHSEHSADPTPGAERSGEKLSSLFDDFSFFESRYHDEKWILDSLGDLKTQVPALKPLMDLDHVGFVGHSIGSHAAQLLGGATIDLPNGERNKSFGDSRVKAVVLLSPSGRGQGGLTDNSWKNMRTPLLSISGGQDHAKGRGVDWRKDAFKSGPTGDKYLLFMEGAYHGLGGIIGTTPKGLDKFFGPDNSEQIDWIKSATLAFFDAYLNNYMDAKAYLQSDAFQKYGNGKFSFEKR